MASVALRRLSKDYPGGVRALDAVDIATENREFLVLLGPSGCGKSTTLRLIAGLETATEGEILIDGRVVNTVPPKDRNIAMVFQNDALYPHMTVYQNMAFGLQLRFGGGGLSRLWRRFAKPVEAAELAVRRRGIRQRVEATARQLGIERLLPRMPKQLSGGERQRVALGRAMVRQPAVFLFDEPLSNLDAKLRLETRRELRRLHRRLETTMIYVTHDQTEALTLGDRIAVLRKGSLQQVGTPTEIFDRPSNQFVAGFVGAPPMNFCKGRLAVLAGRTTFVAAAMQLDLPEPLQAAGDRMAERDVVLGIRPADIKVRAGAAGSEPGWSLPLAGTVTMVEPQGDVSFVHVEVAAPNTDQKNNQVEWVCRATPRCPLRTDDQVEISLDLDRLHLFDATSGRNLVYTADAPAA